MRSFNQTPDNHRFQGLVVCLKASDSAAVVDALELADATAANWESGLAAVYESARKDAWVFVSPPIGGWVLIVGGCLPYPTVQRHDDAG